MRTIVRGAVSAVLLLMLLTPTTGCTYLRALLAGFKLPMVKITSVEPELQSLASAVLHFKLAIKNPNPIGFKMAGIRYGLDVEGKHVADGRTRRSLALRPGGQSATAVDVSVKLVEIASSFLELLAKGRADYNGTFHLAFDTPIGQIEVPISHAGTFPLPKQPPIVLEGIRVGQVSVSGLQLICDLKVANPNPFEMPIDALQMGLTLNNRKLAGASAPRGLKMQPGQPLKIPLKINASFSALGLTVADVARRPRLNYQADVKLASGPLQLPVDLAGQLPLLQ